MAKRTTKAEKVEWKQIVPDAVDEEYLDMLSRITPATHGKTVRVQPDGTVR